MLKFEKLNVHGFIGSIRNAALCLAAVLFVLLVSPFSVSAQTTQVNISANADNYIHAANPTTNYGTLSYLRIVNATISFTSRSRVLIKFDQTQIANALAGKILVSASLQLYIQTNDNNWGTGHTIDAHRITTSWTENGSTWNCPSSVGSCNPQWNGGTFVSTATTSVTHQNSQTGWKNFDVTSDVQAFLSGTVNYGWILKKTDETHAGAVDYTSRTGTSNQRPKLVLTLNQAPTITASLDPVPNANGWNKTNVTVTFNCSDPDGISFCTSPVTVTNEGSNIPVAGTATDNLGYTSNLTVYLKLDKTIPTMSGNVAPAPNGAGWHKTNPTITYSCSDALSGIVTCPSAVAVSTEGANQLISRTVYDQADNSKTVDVTINLDKTAPNLPPSKTPAPNAAGWNKTDVTVSFANTDSLSGVPNPPADVVVTTEGANQPVSASVTDAAGNQGNPSTTVSIDKTAPVISITGVTEGQITASDLTINFSATDANSVNTSTTLAKDGGSPVAFTSGSTVTESGTYVLTVQSTDIADNVSNQVRNFEIDKTPPAIAVTNISEGQFFENAITPNIQVTEAHPGTTTAVINGQSYTIGSEISLDGNYQLSVTSVDSLGNTANFGPLSFGIDAAAPTISVIPDLTNGTIVNYNVNFTIVISDLNLSSSSILLNGNPYSPGTVISAEQVHTLQISGSDPFRSSTYDRTFTIDKTIPSVSITGVSEGQVTGSNLTVTYEATDANLQSVSALLRKNSEPSSPFSSGTTISETGTYFLIVSASDNAGNSTSASRFFEIDKVGPQITIISPGSYVSDSNLIISGTVSDGNGVSEILIDNENVPLQGNSFEAGPFFLTGSRTFAISALDSLGNASNLPLEVTLDTVPPVLSNITPVSGSEIESLSVEVSGSVSDPAGIQYVFVAGGLAEISAGTFDRTIEFAVPGTKSVIVEAWDNAGNRISQQLQYEIFVGPKPPTLDPIPGVTNQNPITISGEAEPNVQVRIVGGVSEQTITVPGSGLFSIQYLLNENQLNQLSITAIEGAEESSVRIAEVLHDNILPVPPTLLNYAGVVPGTSVSLIGITEPNSTVILDGLASQLTTSASPGNGMFGFQFEIEPLSTNNITIFVTDIAGNIGTATEVEISHDPTLHQELHIAVSEPRNWKAPAGTLFPHRLEVILTNSEGEAAQSYPINFEVISGSGLVEGQPSATVLTDSNGKASVTFLLGPEPGDANNIVRATFGDNKEPPATFLITGLEPNPGEPTTVTGSVLDENFRGIPNATVTLIRDGMQNIITFTDNIGDFNLDDVEPGRYHLRADGTTTTLPEQRYPVLVYEIDVFEGQRNTIGMPIFLPRTQLENNLDINGTTPQTYTTPAIPGLKVEIAPDVITYPDGGNSGEFIISPVPINVLPMPLPNGWSTSLAISIQPAGTEFDPPLPIEFPNVDGLPPGSKAKIVSFDHGQGRYVEVGDATVSEDGTKIVSDPGHGIHFGAWHAMVPPKKPPCTNIKCNVQSPGPGICDLITLGSTQQIQIPGLCLTACIAFPPGGSASASAICQIDDDVSVDLDIDSDNTNEMEFPDRSEAEDSIEETQGDVTKPGKVMFVNDGDADSDGVPNFADGIDVYGNQGADAGGKFVPVILEISSQPTAKIQFNYSASNPAEISRTGNEEDGYIYTPASGHLRIWTKDGNQDRKASEVDAGGDFINTGQEYAVPNLSPENTETILLYVEAVDVSSEVAGQSIQVTIENSSSDSTDEDTVRTTVLNLRLVEPDETNNVTPTLNIKASHPSPEILLSNVAITNLRTAENDTKIIGDLTVTGSINCDVCDYTPGVDGEINEVSVYLNNDDTPIPVSTTVSKEFEAPSLLKPYLMTATFNTVIEGVEVQLGANVVTVSAEDKLYGNSGFSEMSIDISGEAPQPVIVDFRASLDFNGATNTSQITPEFAIDISVLNKVNSQSYSGVIYKTSDSPFTLSNSEVTVILTATNLDAALSASNLGQIQGSLFVPSLALFTVFQNLEETSVSSSVFSTNAIDLQLPFTAPLDPMQPDSVDGTLATGLGSIADMLTETGADTKVFQNAAQTFIVTLTSVPAFDPNEIESFEAIVSSSTLSLENISIIAFESDVSSNDFLTSNETIFEEDDFPDFSGWNFSAANAEFIAKSDRGVFHPSMIQLRGPEEFLTMITQIMTEDGPRLVEMGIDGNYYVKMKNSPPLLNLWGWRPGPNFLLDGNASTDFLKGYVQGLAEGGYYMLEGLLILGSTAWVESFKLTPIGFYIEMQSGKQFKPEKEFFEKASKIALSTANVILEIKQDEIDVVSRLMLADIDGAKEIGEDYVVALSLAAEILQAMWKHFEYASSEEQGRIFGRVVFEIASLAISYTKVSNVSKLEFTNALRARPFFQQGEVATAVNRTVSFFEKMATTKMCFVAGTKIHTDTGMKNIEEIRKGDRVLSRDQATGIQAYKTVANTVITHPTTLYHIQHRVGQRSDSHKGSLTEEDSDSDIEELVATGEHPFFIDGKSDFIPAKYLNIGDTLWLAQGKNAEVTNISIENARPGKTFITYNFEVEDFNTYFAGENGVWVHNLSKNPCERLFSIIEYRLNRGDAPADIFRFIEEKYHHNPTFLGDSIVEFYRTKVLNNADAKIWTIGDYDTPGQNLWSHYLKHVIRKIGVPGEEFEDVDSIYRYLQKASEFVSQPNSSSLLRGIRNNRGGYLDSSGLIIQEEVFMDTGTGYFAVKTISGPEAGAIKTFFIRKGDSASRLKYFNAQF